MLNLKEKILKTAKKLFNSDLSLMKGTRVVSFLFIFLSMIIAGGVLFAANTYYDLDTSEVVTEEIQRVTEYVRATGGLIAGGTASQDPDSGVRLQVAGGDLRVGDSTTFNVDESTGNMLVGGTSTFAATSTFQDVAVWQDDDTNVIGFQAPANASGDQIYTLPENPSADYILQTDASGNLSWIDAESTVSGDITDVGDVASGAAFTADGGGNSLWFEGATSDDFETQLTAADPSSDETITMPNLTGTMTLQDGSLTQGSVAFVSSDGRLTEDNTNFYWDDTNNRLGINTNSTSYALDVNGTIRSGQNGTDGELRLYSEGTTDHFVSFQPDSNMTEDTVYNMPADTGSADYVLSTDGSGDLEWTSVSDAGALDGSGTANRVAMWNDADTLTDSSIEDNYTGGVALTIDDSENITMDGDVTVAGTLDANNIAGYTLTGNITGSGTPNITNIGTFDGNIATLANYVQSPEFTNTGETLISSGGGGDIKLDPDSGVIKIASGDHIETAGGYQIATSGNQVLREMVPIFGFDLPAQTASNGHVSVSRTLEENPFSAAKTGSTRKYKLIIRYADDTTGTASAISWQLNGETETNSTFTTDGTATADIEKGEVVIHQLDTAGETIVSTGDNWDLQVDPGGDTIRVYQVFLAAYDQID